MGCAKVKIKQMLSRHFLASVLARTLLGLFFCPSKVPDGGVPAEALQDNTYLLFGAELAAVTGLTKQKTYHNEAISPGYSWTFKPN